MQQGKRKGRDILKLLSNQLRINVEPSVADKEIRFWSDIMRDHMDFYYELLDDTIAENAQLKHKAFELHGDWDAFISRYNGIENLDSISFLDHLLYETLLFKTNVLNIIKEGNWVGSVYESFALETRDELIYFIQALQSPKTDEEEFIYWDEHNRDHALLNTRLLDPIMKAETKEQFDIANDFDSLAQSLGKILSQKRLTQISMPEQTDENQQKLESIEKAIEFSNGTEEVLERILGIRAPRLSSILTTKLVNHLLKELEYGIEKLSTIQGIPFPIES